ncbi:FmdB family zinc ribbon protein [Microbacterium caowuchunii]|uniref:FmdB family transcriptional regulator n=1 Tax=Microbacterium caowuchunii TaxID=2614638 RepID=A0A5N0TG59_9MICO|nr:FmdB family zinc ribbon protein [Microbacterium caowuchunii]KAA9132856.1 FmdB family transcriptional regulator [Microbacterium caowuchunii]
MPTYAYACKSCGHRFDAVQSFSEPTLTECPQCSGVLRKEYGSIGVTFNGSGFYRTDSRSATTSSEKSSSASSGGGESSSSSTSSSTGTTSAAPAAPAAS